MRRYQVIYKNKKNADTSIIIYDFNKRKGSELQRHLADFINRQKGFRKPMIIKGDVKFKHRLLKEER